ncbi:MAG: hypothetical protein AVDCRST_MAG85-3099, partial [uncultured Solirubrobacteraceae bacterium]
ARDLSRLHAEALASGVELRVARTGRPRRVARAGRRDRRHPPRRSL